MMVQFHHSLSVGEIMKNKNTSIKMKQEKLNEKAEEIINVLHSGETTGFINYVAEVNKLESFPLQQTVCLNILKRKQSYTKFHFRKQDLRHYVYVAETLATFLEDNGNKSLAKDIRQEKNNWLSEGLWTWRKKHINKDGKMITKKHKPTGKQQKRSSKKPSESKPFPLLSKTGKPVIRNGQPVQAIITDKGSVKILGEL